MKETCLSPQVVFNRLSAHFSLHQMGMQLRERNTRMHSIQTQARMVRRGSRLQKWMMNGSSRTAMRKWRTPKTGCPLQPRSKDFMSSSLKGRCWRWTLCPFLGGRLLLNEPLHLKEMMKKRRRGKGSGRRESASQYYFFPPLFLEFNLLMILLYGQVLYSTDTETYPFPPLDLQLQLSLTLTRSRLLRKMPSSTDAERQVLKNMLKCTFLNWLSLTNKQYFVLS